MAHAILEERDKLSNHLQQHRREENADERDSFRDLSAYDAFCVAKDLIQDSSEGLLVHRNTGFTNDAHLAYIELWGVLQAIIIQQDAILELSASLGNTDTKLKAPPTDSAWAKIRQIRNQVSGHPVRQDRSKTQTITRTVTGRESKTYESITLHVKESNKRRHISLRLGELIDTYDIEGAKMLKNCRHQLEAQLKQAASQNLNHK